MHRPISMSSLALDVLLISDIHYVNKANHVCNNAHRRSSLGPLLLRKAIQRLRHESKNVDLIIVLGDIVDNGLADGSDQDLAEFRDELNRSKLRYLAVPGNHDADTTRFTDIFDCSPGLHVVNGYGFFIFHDEYAPDDSTTRNNKQMQMLDNVRRDHPDMLLIALQHNPIYPHIESDYPYMPTNVDSIRSEYRKHRILLSLSGHYHSGQPLTHRDGTAYYTVPVACEAPFRFSYLRLRGEEIRIEEHSLKVGVSGIVDVHCHTEFAYCGETVSAQRDIEISKEMGLDGICLVEHVFQLYFDKSLAWSWRWQTEDDLIEMVKRNGRGRMPAYRQFVETFRDDFVYLGIETELRWDGSLFLLEEDRDGWDLIVGAIHNIPEYKDGSGTPAEAERLFLRDTERLLSHPIDVLAHPFRFFRRSKLPPPRHLYKRVAEMMSQTNVAAEVNFHTNEPDSMFVEECLSRGVKIALGSDSHDLAEVGEFQPHLNTLLKAGLQMKDISRVLYRPIRKISTEEENR